MEVSTALLKELKEKTGAGVVDCKNVLIETNGDMNKSIEILNKKGLGKADKKSGREAKEGLVLVKTEGKKGLAVKINCETDFVAKTDAFKDFTKNVLETIFKNDYPFSAELPADVEALRKGVIAKVGENILVSDWKFIRAKGCLLPYLHLGRVGAIVDMDINKDDDEAKQLMKNIAMQITAMNPLSVDPSTIPADKLEEAKKNFAEEAKATGKPEKVIENIVKGKLEKFYSESVLLEQVYIMDEEKKVKQVLEENKAKGIDLKIHSFVREAI
jgi:elongation factor Ts